MIEVMPGIMPKVIEKLRSEMKAPIIAGGLVETEDELREAIRSGAIAVSTSRTELWEI